MRTLLLVVLTVSALATVGCESTEQKAERLRTNQVMTCGRVMPGMAEAGDVSLPQKQADCDVATREYNAFIAGK